ncbi:MAG TPA: hypothetical protein VKS22_00675 [Candidatus Binataceae bacterium]|nr:hypothetical protein [Candidatus Binataceae bacterium]
MLFSQKVRDEHGGKRLRPTKLWANVNTGMAIVIGAWKLDELLNNPVLVEMREKEKAAAKKYTKLDSSTRPRLQKTLAPNAADRIDIPIPTEREVLDVFKKATRKRPSRQKPSS